MGMIKKTLVIGTAAAIGMSAAGYQYSQETSKHSRERGPAPPIKPLVGDELRGDFKQYNEYWQKKKDKEQIGKHAAKLVLVSKGKDSSGKKYPLTYTCPPDKQKHEKPTVYTPETRYPGFCKATGAIVFSAESVKTRFDTDAVTPENWRTYVVGREVTRYWNQDAFKGVDSEKERGRVKEANEHYITCMTGRAILNIDGIDPLTQAGDALVNRTYVPEEQTQRDLYLVSNGGKCVVKDFFNLVA